MYTQRGSKDTQILGFQLHRQIASLQSRLPLIETDPVSKEHFCQNAKD